VSRLAWTTIAAAVLGGIIAVGVLLARGDESNPGSPPADTTTSARGFSLPLAEDPSALALAKHDGNLLVGVAAKPGGPIEVAALRAETPLSTDTLRFELDGSAADASACGNGCSRIDAPVLNGAPSALAVRVGSAKLDFALPARLPPSGEALFARASRTMGALRAYRFTEDLTSGRDGVVTEYEVQAPDRLSLRVRGPVTYRSVIIGRTRWDYHDGSWERSSFPGLKVADVLMWHRATHARIVSHEPGGVTDLAAFGLEPVPAWFRVSVEPSGRVVEAEMIAASHFMTHRYSDFNGQIQVKAPQ
jgi:hypothetical protein